MNKAEAAVAYAALKEKYNEVVKEEAELYRQIRDVAACRYVLISQMKALKAGAGLESDDFDNEVTGEAKQGQVVDGEN